MNKIVSACAAALCLIVTVLSACSPPKTVPLTYTLAAYQGINCLKNVAVLKFEDLRSRRAIGEFGDGEEAMPSEPVAEWIPMAIKNELEATGSGARYCEFPEKYPEPYLITGKVYEAFFTHPVATDYKTVIRFEVVLSKEGREVFTKTYRGETDITVVPVFMQDDASTVMDQALQDILKTAVPELVQYMN